MYRILILLNAFSVPGASYDVFIDFKQKVEIEINSVTDNLIIRMIKIKLFQQEIFMVNLGLYNGFLSYGYG